jgi:NAD(P)-dependent dehydrogenase (short-subunit alcohol dehydrogenase family)
VNVFKDKVAVITGGGSGIGLGIAHALADEGTHILVSDIELDLAREAASDLRRRGVQTLAIRCDVSERSNVEDLAERAWGEFGHVDIIFNNAGVLPPGGSVIDTSEFDARWVLEVNLLGVWHGCSIFGRRFIAQGTPAHIINTGSEHSLGMPHTDRGIYTASKHAVLGLSDVLRHELPDFVGVSVLCPGMVHSNLATATRNRPERFGGPAPGSPDTSSAAGFGMRSGDFGRRVLEGIRRNDFYIVTHPPVRELVEERFAEIATAFDAQAPRYDGDELLDTRAVVRRMEAS